MILSAADQSLIIKLDAAVTTKQLDWTCSYSDKSFTIYDFKEVTQSSRGTLVSGTTIDTSEVTMATSISTNESSSDLERHITEMTVHNHDTVPAVVTLQINDGLVNKRIFFKVNMLPGFQLIYKNGRFQIFDENGAIPTVSYIISSGVEEVFMPFVAAENISQYDLVLSTGFKANSADFNTRNKIIGFATTNVLTGFPGKALTLGKLINPAWIWAAGDRIFADVSGSVSNAAPGSTYVQMVGTATGTTEIDVLIQQSVLL